MFILLASFPLPSLPRVAWEVVAGIAALPPTSGVTATVLCSFLSGCGHVLQQAYGAQLHKVVAFVRSSLMGVIKENTGDGGEQTLAELNGLLEKYSKNRGFGVYEAKKQS